MVAPLLALALGLPCGALPLREDAAAPHRAAAGPRSDGQCHLDPGYGHEDVLLRDTGIRDQAFLDLIHNKSGPEMIDGESMPHARLPHEACPGPHAFPQCDQACKDVPSHGVVYAVWHSVGVWPDNAFGPRVSKVVQSVGALRKVEPTVPVTVMTDSMPDSHDGRRLAGMSANVVLYPNVSERGTLGKIRALQGSPYDVTIWMDADTRPRQAFVSYFAKLAACYDIFGVFAPTLEGEREYFDRHRLPPASMLALNTGVLAIRRSRMPMFLGHWLQLAQQSYTDDQGLHQRGGDQAALARAIFEDDPSRCVLPPQYDALPVHEVPPDQVVISHAEAAAENVTKTP